MMKNKKGAALLQVLLLTVVLAGIATALLRATLSRTMSAHRVARTITAQQLIESCMGEVNTLWAQKTADAFERDLRQHIMYCSGSASASTCTSGAATSYQCTSMVDGFGNTFQVTASIASDNKITYEITTGSNLL